MAWPEEADIIVLVQKDFIAYTTTEYKRYCVLNSQIQISPLGEIA